jgi:hypothetical protein
MLHIAMFEAVNAIDRRYAPYKLKLTADKNVSREAAAAAAAYDVLLTLHPDKKADLDATLAASLAGIKGHRTGQASRCRDYRLARQ